MSAPVCDWSALQRLNYKRFTCSDVHSIVRGELRPGVLRIHGIAIFIDHIFVQCVFDEWTGVLETMEPRVSHFVLGDTRHVSKPLRNFSTRFCLSFPARMRREKASSKAWQNGNGGTSSSADNRRQRDII